MNEMKARVLQRFNPISYFISCSAYSPPPSCLLGHNHDQSNMTRPLPVPGQAVPVEDM